MYGVTGFLTKVYPHTDYEIFPSGIPLVFDWEILEALIREPTETWLGNLALLGSVASSGPRPVPARVAVEKRRAQTT